MKWWVTGAAGFIGTNLVSHLIQHGHQVVGVDDWSREGSETNSAYLEAAHQFSVTYGDISAPDTWDSLLHKHGTPDAIAHLAGQVSLLASIDNPRRDFQVNALGTLNALEFLRFHAPEAALIGMSSNKVYGDLGSIDFEEQALRFFAPLYPNGFDESLPLDFHGPYGCSKGTADQYLIDYGRIFGLRTISLRQSSVYGPHQHPRADQGWVSHLLHMAQAGERIQLNGLGKQVRDLLHAEDLARLISILGEILPRGGHVANVGGGSRNSMSILELFEFVRTNFGTSVEYVSGPVRPSDQKVFVADLQRIWELTGWRPEIGASQGLERAWQQLQSLA